MMSRATPAYSGPAALVLAALADTAAVAVSPLVPEPGQARSAWLDRNAGPLDAARVPFDAGGELLGLLDESLWSAGRNRYSLELHVAFARLFRHNWERMSDVGPVSSPLEEAPRASGAKPIAAAALERTPKAASQICIRRNAACRDLVTAFEKTWMSRVRQANGHRFPRDRDGVEDRDIQLPFGERAEGMRARCERPAHTGSMRPIDAASSSGDTTDAAVAEGLAGE